MISLANMIVNKFQARLLVKMFSKRNSVKLRSVYCSCDKPNDPLNSISEDVKLKQALGMRVKL